MRLGEHLPYPNFKGEIAFSNIYLGIARYCLGMPRNPALVPSVITDVNGRRTTVYRKPDAVVSPLTYLPAPSLMGGVAGLVLRAGDLLGLGDRGRHDLKSSLRSYSPHFLEWFESLLAGDENVVAGIAELVSAGAGEPQIRDTVLFYGVLRDDAAEVAFGKVFSGVRGLSRYELFDEVSEFGRENNDVIQQCVGLLKVTAALGDESLKGLHVVRGVIFNKSLKNLALERPGDASEIARLIREHHVTDAAVIRGLLSGATPSLASGTL